MCEEYQSVQFWIVSSVGESDPYRTEVPVDAGSDIVRPISFFDQDNAASKYSATKYSCESPVDVMDPDHHRSISSTSACTTSASDVATPGHLALNHERGWGSSSSDAGCVTGRSHWSCWDDSDADEAGIDSYTIIGEFDSLMKGSLPEIRVIRPYRSRRSLLEEFHFDESSSKTKARTKARGTYQQYEHEYLADKKAGVFGSGTASSGEILHQSTRFSGFGDLKRRIARFMSSKGRDKAKVAGAKEDRAEQQQKQQDSSDVNDSNDVNDVTRSMNEVSINDTAMDCDATPVCGVVVTQSAEKDPDEDDEDTGEDRVDFLVMIPQT